MFSVFLVKSKQNYDKICVKKKKKLISVFLLFLNDGDRQHNIVSVYYYGQDKFTAGRSDAAELAQSQSALEKINISRLNLIV